MDIAALLENQKQLAEQMAALEKSIATANKSDEIIADVKTALEAVPEAMDLIGKTHSILCFVQDGVWIVQVNPIKILKPKGRPEHRGGNGNGNGNFRGNPVTISDAIKGQYHLTESSFDSIRKLALAVGVSEDDRHPDQTLRKEFPDIWADIKGKVSVTPEPEDEMLMVVG